uniref:Uncharacterized protein n=1 Tax=Chromera velia CCMP2878 TaxID=1169474 RepID=A0A0G4H7X3_9ALVE|eukprot:Cvel_25082.t1-p1 / transcript=Cvel_25082.t1 / gene=Cvel_25082 / organism=Chromera_velia_CCMP2878 / gene_product=hypothetical protein / transcript_product=hypothetical protein / location=Cvel_scaffold2794:17045-19676(+) / protein_length=591 / sequence_SO=supercontig / SO=protein_coding / is_pseudo=false
MRATEEPDDHFVHYRPPTVNKPQPPLTDPGDGGPLNYPPVPMVQGPRRAEPRLHSELPSPNRLREEELNRFSHSNRFASLSQPAPLDRHRQGERGSPSGLGGGTEAGRVRETGRGSPPTHNASFPSQRPPNATPSIHTPSMANPRAQMQDNRLHHPWQTITQRENTSTNFLGAAPKNTSSPLSVSVSVSRLRGPSASLTAEVPSSPSAHTQPAWGQKQTFNKPDPLADLQPRGASPIKRRDRETGTVTGSMLKDLASRPTFTPYVSVVKSPKTNPAWGASLASLPFQSRSPRRGPATITSTHLSDRVERRSPTVSLMLPGVSPRSPLPSTDKGQRRDHATAPTVEALSPPQSSLTREMPRPPKDSAPVFHGPQLQLQRKSSPPRKKEEEEEEQEDEEKFLKVFTPFRYQDREDEDDEQTSRKRMPPLSYPVAWPPHASGEAQRGGSPQAHLSASITKKENPTGASHRSPPRDQARTNPQTRRPWRPPPPPPHNMRMRRRPHSPPLPHSHVLPPPRNPPYPPPHVRHRGAIPRPRPSFPVPPPQAMAARADPHAQSKELEKEKETPVPGGRGARPFSLRLGFREGVLEFNQN